MHLPSWAEPGRISGGTAKRYALFVSTVIALAACDHSTPYAVTEPEPQGPATSDLPRRLTFNMGTDRDPSATADHIVYTQFPPGRSDRDGCIASLPPAGGTLTGLHCPGGPAADDRQDAWLFPTLSRDGRIAYLWEWALIGGIVPNGRTLRVATAEHPDSVLLEQSPYFSLPDGRRVTAIRDLMWDEAGRIRFVAGVDSYSVNLGVWDTTFIPFTLATLDPADGEYRAVSGSEGAYTHLTAGDDGVWFVAADAPHQLRLRAADGTVTTVATFTRSVLRLAEIDGAPAALGSAADSVHLQRIDPVTGAPAGVYAVAGRANAVAGIPGTNRFVLEIELARDRDLWLHEWPR
jgi:hypothetical protein